MISLEPRLRGTAKPSDVGHPDRHSDVSCSGEAGTAMAHLHRISRPDLEALAYCHLSLQPNSKKGVTFKVDQVGQFERCVLTRMVQLPPFDGGAAVAIYCAT